MTDRGIVVWYLPARGNVQGKEISTTGENWNEIEFAESYAGSRRASSLASNSRYSQTEEKVDLNPEAKDPNRTFKGR